mgnify:CR=1 FL=1
MSINQTIYNLPNKVNALAVNSKKFTQFTVFFFVRVGSKNETSHENGISHILEHMVFKKTEKFKDALSMSIFLEKHGISFNAYTSNNMTCYYFNCSTSANNLDKCFYIADQMIKKMVINEEHLKKERNVILQEYYIGNDNPSAYFRDLLENKYFDNHPLSQYIIGTKENILNISKKQIQQFYKNHYKNENISIGIIGNVPSNFKNLLYKYFSDKLFDKNKIIETKIKQSTPESVINNVLKNKNIKQLKPFTKVINNSNKIINVDNKNINQNYIVFMFPQGGLFDKDIEHHSVIADIVGGNGSFTSKLFQLIREKHGLTYNINVSNINYEEGGLFKIQIQVNTEDTRKTIKIIINALKRFKKKGLINIKELKELKSRVLDNLSTSLDNLSTLDNLYLDKYIFENKIFNMKDYKTFIKSLKKNIINEKYNQLIDLNKCQILCYGKCKLKFNEKQFK